MLSEDEAVGRTMTSVFPGQVSRPQPQSHSDGASCAEWALDVGDEQEAAGWEPEAVISIDGEVGLKTATAKSFSEEAETAVMGEVMARREEAVDLFESIMGTCDVDHQGKAGPRTACPATALCKEL